MISIVATVYNEMAVIADFLVQLHAFSGDAEVIVVDGLSDDGTYELLCELRRRGEGWFTLARSEKCRGAALNEGARLAKGDALLFVHADCSLPDNALALVETALKDCQAGCFKVRFGAPGLFMRYNELASNARVRLFGIMFGDQGIFAKRDFFWQTGGFPELPLMEDYEFSLRLKALGVRPGLARGCIVASPRRYVNGPRSRLGTALNMLWLRVRYRCGCPASKLERDYGTVR